MANFHILGLLMVYLILSQNSIFTKILSVFNINRHGARTPKTFSKIAKNLYYGSSDSQLVINGFRQHQLLGRWMYNRYVNDLKFLSKDYNKNDSIFFSSPSQRAIFSGTAFLQGLYPDYIIRPIFNIEKSNMKQDSIPPIINFELPNIEDIPLNINNAYNDNVFHATSCRLNAESTKSVMDEAFIQATIFEDPTMEEIVGAIDDVKNHCPYLFTGVEPDVYYSMKFYNKTRSKIH